MVPKRTTERRTDSRAQANGAEFVGITIAIVILVTMIGVVIPLVAANSGTVTVTNETVTSSLEYNTTYELEGFEVVSGSETVYVENGSAGSFETLASSEYTVDEGPGTLNVTGQSGSSAGDEVLITYDYEATDSTTQTVVDLLALFLALLGLVALSRPIQDRLG